jgi:hypothetical protein
VAGTSASCDLLCCADTTPATLLLLHTAGIEPSAATAAAAPTPAAAELCGDNRAASLPPLLEPPAAGPLSAPDASASRCGNTPADATPPRYPLPPQSPALLPPYPPKPSSSGIAVCKGDSRGDRG